MKIAIKNMVCQRCIMAVENEMNTFGYQIRSIALGEVDILEELSASDKEALAHALSRLGFELIDNKQLKLIEEVKHVILQAVRDPAYDAKVNLSILISEKLHHDYNQLSNLFSETEGITIEKYMILQKIEYVKELLVYDELSLSEIAYKLHYSSVAYLSNQFKKITGLTPSHFKKIKANKRIPIDHIHSSRRLL